METHEIDGAKAPHGWQFVLRKEQDEENQVVYNLYLEETDFTPPKQYVQKLDEAFLRGNWKYHLQQAKQDLAGLKIAADQYRKFEEYMTMYSEVKLV